MAEKRLPGVRIISAPYMPDAYKLVLESEESEQLVFCRVSSKATTTGYRDIVSVGPFEMHELRLGSSMEQWDQQLEAFYKLDTGAGPLAGYLSYEAGLAFESPWQKMAIPLHGEYAWRFARLSSWYIADHVTDSGSIVVMDGCEDRGGRLLELVDKASCKSRPLAAAPSAPINIDELASFGELTAEKYAERIGEILEDIRSGRFYELNFTQRFRFHGSTKPSAGFVELFQRLLPRNGFYCNFQDQCVLSLSPELYLYKNGDRISTRPIKGSMVTGVSSAEWEKLHAEHIMVVDLARNDLGRISDKAPVTVTELVGVKEFGGLRHLESAISGTTSSSWQDVIAATYPAASITGAPKVEVVKAIHSYEVSRRNVYTGSCGVIWPDGNLDLNVAIRTATASQVNGEWHYEAGAGGAIVADSDPTSEYAECLRKISPVVTELARMNIFH